MNKRGNERQKKERRKERKKEDVRGWEDGKRAGNRKRKQADRSSGHLPLSNSPTEPSLCCTIIMPTTHWVNHVCSHLAVLMLNIVFRAMMTDIVVFCNELRAR